jgi:hypothetical protein
VRQQIGLAIEQQPVALPRAWIANRAIRTGAGLSVASHLLLSMRSRSRLLPDFPQAMQRRGFGGQVRFGCRCSRPCDRSRSGCGGQLHPCARFMPMRRRRARIAQMGW